MMAESFRALRTNIQFKDTEKKTKTIAVVSTTTEEGKTLVIINLAITMAQAGMKILLVGSDLRKPMVHRVFGVELTPGITDILLGNYPWRDTVKTVTDMIMGKMTPDEVMMTPGLDNLHIITSGTIPPNPTELIDSKRLMDFIEETKKEYDMLLFDSAPILSTADGVLLGSKMDGVLLVYRVGTVPRGLLKRSTTQLEQVKCNIMGVILNGMRPEVSRDFPDYKRYRYNYGEENEEIKSRGYKRVFSFLRKGGDGHRRPEQKISLGKGEEKPQENQHKKPNMLRLFLMLLAIAFLVVGMLWQYGIMDPLKLIDLRRPVKKDEIRTFVKKKIPDMAIQRKPEVIPEEPKSTVSIEKSELDSEASMPKPRPVPYSLYLGSFRTLERAEKAISLYSKKGLHPSSGKG
jgi:capsular exopolysaccharide synthesis family protein